MALLLLGLSLAGCHALTMDPRIDAETKAGFDDLRRGDFNALDGLLAPDVKTPDLSAKLAQLRAFIPDREPRARKIVGWNMIGRAGGEATVDVSDEYDFGDRIALWNTRLYRKSSADRWEIQGLHIDVATVRQLAANRFTLTDKKPLQYLFLLAAALSPALMIAALVTVIRTKSLTRKWLWGIASFAGIFSFQMNWATGRIVSNFLTVQLIGAGATRGDSAFAAWVITTTLPLGALLILAGVWANPDKAAKPAAGERS